MLRVNDQINIPDKYWPRCGWCGRPLPECSVSHQTVFGEIKVCPVCCSLVGELIKRWAPGYIEDALGLFKDKDEPPRFVTLSHTDISKMARENMEKAQHI